MLPAEEEKEFFKEDQPYGGVVAPLHRYEVPRNISFLNNRPLFESVKGK